MSHIWNQDDGRCRGQALVEIALIFPLFLIVVFGVMQIGQLAAMTIIVNHAAFEVARIGAITAKLPEENVSCGNVQINKAKMTMLARNIFEKWPGKLMEPLQAKPRATLRDPETEPPRLNCDLDLSIQYQMPLVFPFVNMFLAQAPYGGYDPEVGTYRIVTGQSRMPLEMPLW